MSIRALSVRDLIALTFVACRTVACGTADVEASTLVALAYSIADEFTLRSVAGWAADERERKTK